MADDDARAELGDLLVDARTVREHLDEFAVRAGARLGRGTHCSISLRHAGRDRLAASSSERSAACDEVEYRYGEGPCVTAMDDLQVVLVPDLATEVRWPRWAERTREVGFRSSAAVPANVDDDADVALNLYSDRLDPWDRAALLEADTFAQEVARTVRLCLRVADLALRVEDSRAAVETGDLVNRAVGALMATHRCSAPDALERLRSAAADRGADLADVARGTLADLAGDGPG